MSGGRAATETVGAAKRSGWRRRRREEARVIKKRREEAGVARDESREDGAGKGGRESRVKTLVRAAKRRMVDG